MKNRGFKNQSGEFAAFSVSPLRDPECHGCTAYILVCRQNFCRHYIQDRRQHFDRGHADDRDLAPSIGATASLSNLSMGIISITKAADQCVVSGARRARRGPRGGRTQGSNLTLSAQTKWPQVLLCCRHLPILSLERLPDLRSNNRGQSCGGSGAKADECIVRISCKLEPFGLTLLSCHLALSPVV